MEREAAGGKEREEDEENERIERERVVDEVEGGGGWRSRAYSAGCISYSCVAPAATRGVTTLSPLARCNTLFTPAMIRQRSFCDNCVRG